MYRYCTGRQAPNETYIYFRGLNIEFCILLVTMFTVAFIQWQSPFRAVRLQADSSTVRYHKVCDGCSSWKECLKSTVADSNRDPTCSIVPEPTFAGQPGATLETLSIEKGYWRATKERSTILACYNQAACLGGQTGADTSCNVGYTGACE